MDLFDPNTKQVLLQRLEQRYQDGDLHGVFILGQYYNPEQMIQEARAGTTVGEHILFGEKKLHDELKRLGGMP